MVLGNPDDVHAQLLDSMGNAHGSIAPNYDQAGQIQALDRLQAATGSIDHIRRSIRSRHWKRKRIGAIGRTGGWFRHDREFRARDPAPAQRCGPLPARRKHP